MSTYTCVGVSVSVKAIHTDPVESVKGEGVEPCAAPWASAQAACRGDLACHL